MIIQRAREILGEKGNKYTDEQLQGIINTLTVISNIAIDQAMNKYKKKIK